ncbi:hypothetical protein BSG1_08656 [Bacillus sp. SG-1]|nr:hypothetical protein BSG1_08656 [Bacillus sp. SG-1]
MLILNLRIFIVKGLRLFPLDSSGFFRFMHVFDPNMKKEAENCSLLL